MPARRQHGADGDVFDERGIDLGAGDERLQAVHEQVGGRGVFERAFAAFGEGGAQRAGHDDIIGCVVEEGGAAPGGGDVRGELGETLLG